MKKTHKTRKLTPAQKKFAQVYAVTDNATEAVRQAYPESAGKSTAPSLHVKAHRLLRNVNVIQSVAEQKQELEALSAHAIARIANLIDSEDETVAGVNSRWVAEQVHGKATVKVETKSAHVTVVYNLGGDSAPDMPEHIKEKLQGH